MTETKTNGNRSPQLNEFLTDLGTRVRDMRKTNRLSQVDLASAAGLDRAYLSGVENGKHNVTVGALLRLSAALKVEPASLMSTHQDR